MPVKWIDFRAPRERLDASAVLAAYKINLKVKGDQAQGFCPLPTHKKHEGRRKSPSFSINLRRKCFQCFSCGTSGNLIDLAAILEGLDPKNPSDIRAAALLLDERFPELGSLGQASPTKPSKPKANQSAPDGSEQKIVVNAPLDFTLKNLEQDHPYLLNRGFTRETIEHFGLGFCSKGLMKDRLAIPLQDQDGNLIGYAGRIVDDELITDENPRYRFPSGRTKDDVFFDFQKGLFLYNGCEIARSAPFPEVVVVESFTGCWWLHQNDFPNVVGLMGASCSDVQAKLIVSLTLADGVVTILTDGDDAGERCAVSVFTGVAPQRRVRWLRLRDGKQPTDFDDAELKNLFARY